jgi:hypothetical protein
MRRPRLAGSEGRPALGEDVSRGVPGRGMPRPLQVRIENAADKTNDAEGVGSSVRGADSENRAQRVRFEVAGGTRFFRFTTAGGAGVPPAAGKMPALPGFHRISISPPASSSTGKLSKA